MAARHAATQLKADYFVLNSYFEAVIAALLYRLKAIPFPRLSSSWAATCTAACALWPSTKKPNAREYKAEAAIYLPRAR